MVARSTSIRQAASFTRLFIIWFLSQCATRCSIMVAISHALFCDLEFSDVVHLLSCRRQKTHVVFAHIMPFKKNCHSDGARLPGKWQSLAIFFTLSRDTPQRVDARTQAPVIPSWNCTISAGTTQPHHPSGSTLPGACRAAAVWIDLPPPVGAQGDDGTTVVSFAPARPATRVWMDPLTGWLSGGGGCGTRC